MGERAAHRDLDDSYVAAKHQGASAGCHSRLHVEAHALQSLVLAPCGDASGDLVESHDAVIGADVERLVVGPDDAHHAVAHECAVVLVVVAVVVVLLVEHDQAVVVSAHIHGAVGILIDGVYSESLDRQLDALLRVGALLEAVQSVLGAYPQMVIVLGGDAVDASEYLRVVDLELGVGVIADVEQLVFSSCPHGAVGRVETHGLYVLLWDDEVGLHKVDLPCRLVYNVYACRISSQQHLPWHHLTHGEEVMIGVGRGVAHREQSLPLLAPRVVYAHSVVGGVPQVVLAVLEDVVDAIVGEGVDAEVRAPDPVECRVLRIAHGEALGE